MSRKRDATYFREMREERKQLGLCARCGKRDRLATPERNYADCDDCLSRRRRQHRAENPQAIPRVGV